MMFISVDLPEPDGAHDGDELALGDLEVDTIERHDFAPRCPAE